MASVQIQDVRGSSGGIGAEHIGMACFAEDRAEKRLLVRGIINNENAHESPTYAPNSSARHSSDSSIPDERDGLFQLRAHEVADVFAVDRLAGKPSHHGFHDSTHVFGGSRAGLADHGIHRPVELFW